MDNFRKVPWLVDEAVEFLRTEIEKGNIETVLEFGSGASTLWLADRVDTIVSVEHDPGWYNKISTRIGTKSGADYRLRERPYNSVCDENLPVDKFDLVIIDGKDRIECVKSSHDMVRKGGYLLVDNSDMDAPWSPEIFDFLKSWKRRTWVQSGPDQEGHVAPDGIKWETTVFFKEKK